MKGGGVPVNRQWVLVTHTGAVVIDWGDDQFQDVHTGEFIRVTQEEISRVDRTRTYNLGATGLRGWIYTKPANFFESCQGRTTTASRQIMVTHVGEKSPAEGVLRVDGVILGASGKPFADDARQSIALAIQEAEKEAPGGILTLTRWRAGKTQEVRLKLRVMGTYSETSPYD